MAVSAPGFFEMDDAPLRLHIEDMFSDYVHAIDDDPVEIEDQQGAIIHGQKLGR